MGALSDAFGAGGIVSRKKKRDDSGNVPAGASGDPDPITSYSKQRGGSGGDDSSGGVLTNAKRLFKRGVGKSRS